MHRISRNNRAAAMTRRLSRPGRGELNRPAPGQLIEGIRVQALQGPPER